MGRILRAMMSLVSELSKRGRYERCTASVSLLCTALVSFRHVATETSLHSDIWTAVLGG